MRHLVAEGTRSSSERFRKRRHVDRSKEEENGPILLLLHTLDAKFSPSVYLNSERLLQEGDRANMSNLLILCDGKKKSVRNISTTIASQNLNEGLARQVDVVSQFLDLLFEQKISRYTPLSHWHWLLSTSFGSSFLIFFFFSIAIVVTDGLLCCLAHTIVSSKARKKSRNCFVGKQ